MQRARASLAAVLLVAAGAVCAQALDQFLRAVNEGNLQAVTALLNQGIEPDTADPQGNTALMIAARLGRKELVALLLARKANVGRQNPFGDTALNFAALGGHLEVVRLLVEHGAQVVPASGWSPLQYAAFENRAEVVKYLIQKGAQKDALAPNGYTALMLAVRGGHVAAATALLYEDVDLGIKGPGGETALGIAMGRKDEEMIRLLKRAGAAN